MDERVTAATILVADDQDDLRMLVRMRLVKQGGWTVIEAANGSDALERCLGGGIDLAVLDERMPGRTGLEVAREIRAAGAPVRLVLFSAFVDDELRRDAAQLGMPTVSKTEISHLTDVVREVLGTTLDEG